MMITYDKAFKPEILKAFKYRVRRGVIVDARDKPVLDVESDEPVSLRDFAGIVHNEKGQVRLVSSKLPSLIKAADLISAKEKC